MVSWGGVCQNGGMSETRIKGERYDLVIEQNPVEMTVYVMGSGKDPGMLDTPENSITGAPSEAIELLREGLDSWSFYENVTEETA